jgi:hypothetical protein
VAYFNSGCWTELPCTYLTVRAGAVRLHEFGAEAAPAFVPHTSEVQDHAPCGL